MVFYKYHGCGNDFVLIDEIKNADYRSLADRLCLADHGKTIFYEQEGTDTIKHLLLESYGCEHRSLGYANMTNEDYKKFYLEAIDNIKSDMTQKAPILI